MLFFLVFKVWSDVLTTDLLSLQIKFVFESGRQVNSEKQQKGDWIASSGNRPSLFSDEMEIIQRSNHSLKSDRSLHEEVSDPAVEESFTLKVKPDGDWI